MSIQGQLMALSSGMQKDGRDFWAFEPRRPGPNTLENFMAGLSGSSYGEQLDHHEFFGQVAPLDELPGKMYFLGITDIKVYSIDGMEFVVGVSPEGLLCGYTVKYQSTSKHE